MESLSMKLMGSVGELLAAQGHVPKGPYTIVHGIITHVDHPRPVERWYEKTNKFSDRYVPSVLRDVQVPAQPIVHCDPVPVNDRTSIQKLLKDLGFKHYTEEYAFYSEPCKTQIFPIIHIGLSGFTQDYVARVDYREGNMKKIWERTLIKIQAPAGI